MSTLCCSQSSRLSLIAAALVSLGSITLAGCGIGTLDNSVGPVSLPAISVQVMGGEIPVAGSTITLWETGSSGYGSGATKLAGPVTGSSPGGGFSFSTGYSCASSSDFVYVTSTGGDITNGGATPSYNPSLVLAAALGPCSDFVGATAQGKINIVINELSTIAVAYALGSFTTVTAGSAGQETVSIGAPSNNNATTGTCTSHGTTVGGNYTGMTCVAAGLAHAFSNAANLVNAVTYTSGTTPTGQAYSAVPGNSLTSVPQAFINTLGNIVQYCTNSGNSSSTSTTVTSQCNAMFGYMTPMSGTLPSDTLTALINLAHNPVYAGSTSITGTTCTGTPAVTGGLWCLAAATGAAFQPVLTAAPHDWSLAISYSGTSLGSFGQPQFATLDANDNVYVMTSNSYTGTTNGIAAMTSSGTGLWSFAQSSSYCVPGTLATDTNGYVWMSVNASSTSACPFAIYGFPTANGGGGTPTYTFGPGSGTVCGLTSGWTSSTCPGFSAYDTTHKIQSTTFGLAFDGSNNLWYDRKSGTCSNCIFELPYITGSPGTYGTQVTEENGADTISGDSDQQYATEGGQIVIDSNLDVFVGNQGNGAGSGSAYVFSGFLYLPNVGSLAAPIYVSETVPSTATTANGYAGTAANGYTAVSTTGEDGGGLALDSSGNVWLAVGTGTAGGYEYTPSPGTYSTSSNSYSVQPSLTAGSTFSNNAAHPYYSQMDGLGVLWYPNLNNAGQLYNYVTHASSIYSSTGVDGIIYVPCYLPSAATTCAATAGTYATGDAKSLNIDSTGSIWMAAGISSSLTTGNVVQIIGLAYPAWPQASYGKSGVEPQ